ncbi:DDE-type integrase/transposase/recombinase [Sphingomonas sp. LT1P40]
MKINGEMHYLWRAVGQEGEVLESFVTKTRDKAAALRFMKKALKRHGSPETITTDGLGSYRAAMKLLGNAEKQEIGRWANNRVENSHLPFRRRERAMLRFRQMKSLQKFASVHANVHNHFSLERHLVDRQTFKERRSAALAEWQSLARALSDQRGTSRETLLTVGDEPEVTSEAALPVPLFQLVAGGDPPCGDDVREVSAVAAERRGPAVRARHRHLSRDSTDVVEQVRTDVRWRHPSAACVPHARLPTLAMAPR